MRGCLETRKPIQVVLASASVGFANYNIAIFLLPVSAPPAAESHANQAVEPETEDSYGVREEFGGAAHRRPGAPRGSKRKDVSQDGAQKGGGINTALRSDLIELDAVNRR